MKRAIFLFAFLSLAVGAPSALAQTVVAEANVPPDCPVQITSAACAPTDGGGHSCNAKFRVGASDVIAIGFKWVLTFADGRTHSLRQFIDGALASNVAFRAGEEAESGASRTGVKSPDGKPQVPVRAAFQVEFVVPAPGKFWGNAQSPTYWQMLGQRHGYRQALVRLKSIYATSGLPALLKELGVCSGEGCGK